MSSLLGRFFSLPPAMQLIVGATGGGSVLGALVLAAYAGTTVFVIVLVGLVAIVLLLLLYAFILGRIRKRKANPFERSIRESGAAGAGGARDVADRARLDDMRKKFEKGVSTFRENGKDLYSLPWFVIIGEPGSGKTEAIRHSGIGFPPGLQDELQGTGGTINMDWWFTNTAVILDTAGRLTFGDVDSSDTREWREFLRLLRKNRPNCPINGLLITIPVDSLVQDDADELDRKGGRLARQLDLIQKTLGVRFPVFVIVTKADKLLGFRQFFQRLRDPALQGQMVGWANPAPLDEPFNPAAVEQHIEQVRARLVRRRLGLLLDPVHTEDPAARRADQVDDLYAFPEALQRITSRLRRYLEQIFVAGEWSSKPLFLRGIFFTSSMQHGEALDAELAEAVGVPLESLHEAAWTEDKAYFLHDVCMEKIFREKGLVTNAGNTRAQQRKRRTIVLGAGAVAIVLLAALVITAWVGYGAGIDPPRRFWRDASAVFADNRNYWRVVEATSRQGQEYQYQGQQPLRAKDIDAEGTIVSLVTDSRRWAGDEIRTPLAFKPIAWWKGEIGFRADRIRATQTLFDEGVLRPLVDRALARLTQPDAEWPDDATDALVQLVDARAFADVDGPRPASLGRAFDVGALLRFALAENYDEDAQADVETYQATFDFLYQEAGSAEDEGKDRNAGARRGDLEWPPEWLAKEVDDAALQPALDRFHAHWRSRGQEGGEMHRIDEIREATAAFESAEQELLEIRCVKGASTEVAAAAGRDWAARYETLRARKGALDAGVDAAGDSALGKALENGKLASAWTTVRDQGREVARSAYDRLFTAALRAPEASVAHPPAEIAGHGEAGTAEGDSAAASGPGAGPAEGPAAEILAEWKRLASADASEETRAEQREIARLDRTCLALTRNDAAEHLYQARFRMYETANEVVRGSPPPEQLRFGDTADVLRGSGERLKQAIQGIDDIARLSAPAPAPTSPAEAAAAADRFPRASKIATCAVEELGRRTQDEAAATRFLDKLGDARDEKAVGALVAAEADAGGASGGSPAPGLVPLTRLEMDGFESQYDSVVGAALLKDWSAVCGARQALSTDLKGRIQKIEPAMHAYAAGYLEYWTDGVIEQLHLAADSWSAFQKALDDHYAIKEFEQKLTALHDRIERALLAISGACLGLDDARVTGERDKALHAVGAASNGEAFLKSWGRLGETAKKARQDLIEQIRGRTFESNDYFVSNQVAPFWSTLGEDAVVLLQNEVQKEANQAVNELKGEAKFPLPPASGRVRVTDQLQADRIPEIRRYLDEVRTNLGRPVEFREPVPKRIEDALRAIIEPAAAARIEPEWINALDECLQALEGGPFEVEVNVFLEEGQGSDSVSNVWRDLRIRQKGQNTTVKRHPGSGGEESLGKLGYPGDEVVIELLGSDGKPDDAARLVGSRLDPGGAPLRFAGPWAPVLMLYECDAKRTGQDGKRWEITMTVRDKDKIDRKLRLRLLFQKGVPEAMVP